MSIITVSRGSYSKGKEIAEKVSDRLGYTCISRDIVLEASEEFNVPEIKLIRAIHDAPSIFNTLGLSKKKYIAYIKSALLYHFIKDNVVYHGLAGHYFVQNIPHVFKVRIIADMETRVAEEMKREGITREEALRVLKMDDEERRKWGQTLYGIDTADSSLYDMKINIHRITVDHAVDLICNAIRYDEFQTTEESRKMLNDLILAADANISLLNAGFDTEVSAENGVVHIKVQAPLSYKRAFTRDIQGVLSGLKGVNTVNINVVPITPLSE